MQSILLFSPGSDVFLAFSQNLPYGSFKGSEGCVCQCDFQSGVPHNRVPGAQASYPYMLHKLAVQLLYSRHADFTQPYLKVFFISRAQSLGFIFQLLRCFCHLMRVQAIVRGSPCCDCITHTHDGVAGATRRQQEYRYLRYMYPSHCAAVH